MLNSKNLKDPNGAIQKQEPLVSLTGVSERIQVYPYYFKQKLPGSVNDCFVREGVMKKLLTVVNSIPENYNLVILDGWRSFETQNALFEMAKQQFQSMFDSESDLLSHVSKFVATPSTDFLSSSPHYTGGAVDLTIASKDGWLNMGTAFDEFTEKASSLYFEGQAHLTKEELEIRDNRRLLRYAMENAGFCINPDEWWHFDYGNSRWAKETALEPIYYGIELNTKGRENHD